MTYAVNLPIASGITQNPYRQFTYVLQPQQREKVGYAFNYFRCLNISGTGLKVRFGASGGDTDFIGAGIGFFTPNVIDFIEIVNTSGSPITITFALAIGLIYDDRLSVSGNISVVNGAGTFLLSRELSPDVLTDGTDTVGTSAVVIVGPNSNRKEVIITNTHASNDLYLGGATVAVGRGIKLVAGQSTVLTNSGTIYAVGSAAGTTIALAFNSWS